MLKFGDLTEKRFNSLDSQNNSDKQNLELIKGGMKYTFFSLLSLLTILGISAYIGRDVYNGNASNILFKKFFPDVSFPNDYCSKFANSLSAFYTGASMVNAIYHYNFSDPKEAVNDLNNGIYDAPGTVATFALTASFLSDYSGYKSIEKYFSYLCCAFLPFSILTSIAHSIVQVSDSIKKADNKLKEFTKQNEEKRR